MVDLEPETVRPTGDREPGARRSHREKDRLRERQPIHKQLPLREAGQERPAV